MKQTTDIWWSRHITLHLRNSEVHKLTQFFILSCIYSITKKFKNYHQKYLNDHLIFFLNDLTIWKKMYICRDSEWERDLFYLPERSGTRAVFYFSNSRAQRFGSSRVSVERNFATIKYMISDLRCRTRKSLRAFYFFNSIHSLEVKI